ncbi:hypothetical protein AEGHOMDF_3408 [Methylobacterium soli]|nr:hypothetical protein AEGHOMDF_3408 [Methylobacterium soli]
MDLQAAHAGREPAGHDLDRVAHPEGAAAQGAGDDGAETRPGEDPIDGQVGKAVIDRRRGLLEEVRQRPAESLDAAAGRILIGGDRGGDHGRVEARSGDRPGDLRHPGADGTGGEEVAFRQRDHAAAHTDQPGDLQVLDGLGLDALAGIDRQEHGPHPGRPGDHGPDEALVTRQVDEIDLGGRVPVGRAQQCEARNDRDAPFPLLLQAIRLDPGQSPHERGLAVVDMTDHAHKQRLHRGVTVMVDAKSWWMQGPGGCKILVEANAP